MRRYLCFLLTLNLMSCAIFHRAQGQYHKDRLLQVMQDAFQKKDSKTFSITLEKWESQLAKENSQRGLSEIEGTSPSLTVLDEWYDYFIREVDYEIHKGLAQKDQKRVLSGLQSLKSLFPQNPEKDGIFKLPEPGRKEALVVFERIHTLLDNHLKPFSEGEPSREDYWQLAEDYKAIADSASEYFMASFQQNKVLRDFAQRKSQMAASMLPFLGVAAIIAATMTYLSIKGLKDDMLLTTIRILKISLRTCLNGTIMEEVFQDPRYRSGFVEFLGTSYTSAKRKFCSQEPSAIDSYESLYGDVDRTWFRGSICEKIGASSKDNCFFRQWFCEKVEELKKCLQVNKIQW